MIMTLTQSVHMMMLQILMVEWIFMHRKLLLRLSQMENCLILLMKLKIGKRCMMKQRKRQNWLKKLLKNQLFLMLHQKKKIKKVRKLRQKREKKTIKQLLVKDPQLQQQIICSHIVMLFQKIFKTKLMIWLEKEKMKEKLQTKKPQKVKKILMLSLKHQLKNLQLKGRSNSIVTI